MLSTAHRIVRRLAEMTATFGMVLLVFQCVAIVVDVMMRWLAGQPVYGLADTNQLLIAVSVAAFLPQLLLRRANITITAFGKLLGKRLNAWLNSFGHMTTLIFVVIVTWQMFRYASEVTQHVSPIVEIPISPVWWITAMIVAACIPVQLVVFVVDLREAVSRTLHS